MADVGLEAADGQHDAALLTQQRAEALGVGGGQGAALVVAVQQVGDGALGQGEAAPGQLAVDLGGAAVFGIAGSPDDGEDVEAKLVMREGEVGLGLGAVGGVVAGAVRVGAAADLERESQDGVEGGNGAEVVVVGPEATLANRAVGGERGEGLGAVGARAWSGAGLWGLPPRAILSLFYAPTPNPVKFATLEKNGRRPGCSRHEMGGGFLGFP